MVRLGNLEAEVVPQLTELVLHVAKLELIEERETFEGGGGDD
jgi:hypothetical protein